MPQPDAARRMGAICRAAVPRAGIADGEMRAPVHFAHRRRWTDNG